MKKLILLVLLFCMSFAQPQPSPRPGPEDFSEGINTITDIVVGDETMDKFIANLERTEMCEAPKSWFDVFGTSFLALLVVSMFYTVAYMAGKLLNYPITDALLRIKFDEVATSAVIILAILSAYSLLNISGGGSYYYLDQAVEYNKMVLRTVLKNLGILSLYSLAINLLSTVVINIVLVPDFPIIRFPISLGPAMKPIIEILSHSSNMAAMVVVEWTTMFFTLCIIKKWWLSFVLPLGILLRSLSITKDAGNTLIALGVGLYFLYPILLTINYDIFDAGIGRAAAAGLSNMDVLLVQIKGIFAGPQIILWMVLFGILLFVTQGKIAALALLSLLYIFFDTLAQTLFLIVIVSLFLPAVNIFITLTFVMELGRMLGTDINVSALTRLI